MIASLQMAEIVMHRAGYKKTQDSSSFYFFLWNCMGWNWSLLVYTTESLVTCLRLAMVFFKAKGKIKACTVSLQYIRISLSLIPLMTLGIEKNK